MVSVWDWSARYCTYRRERPSGFGLISDWMVGGLYLFWRLGQCTRVLKVSLLETGHTWYCSISGSDPLLTVFVTGTVVKHQPTLEYVVGWEVILVSVLENGLPGSYRERPSLLDLLSEFGLISDRWLGSLGDWANALEGLKVSILETGIAVYLREWPTPTVVIIDMALSLSPNIHPSIL